MKTYPCCAHCFPEPGSGRCWAAVIGHGASCLKCQTDEVTS